MAERVEIRGGDLDGSILNNAASEATLLRLVNIMEKSSGSAGGGTGSGRNKLQDMYNKSLNSSNKELKNTTESLSALGNSFNKAKDTVSGSLNLVGNLLTKSFGAALSGATFAILGLKDYLITSYETFKQTSNVGAAFGNDMTKLGQIATQNGMSLSQFGKLITDNSKILTAFGGTATGGAKRLAEFRDEMFKPGGVAAGLNGLGLATSDIEEYMGSYLEVQKRLGGLETRNTRELAASTAMYVEELDKVSKITGANRKELEASAKRQALDPVINAMRATIEQGSPQMAKAIANMTAVQEMGGQELEDAIKEIATGVVTSPLAKELVSAGAITRESAEGIVMGNVEAADEIAKAGKMMEATNKYNNKTLIQGNENIRAGAKFVQQQRQYMNASTDEARKEAAQRKALTTAFGRFPEILNQIRNKVFGAFLNSPFFQKTIDFLNGMADKISSFIDSIEFGEYVTKFTNIIDTVFGGAGNALTKVSEVMMPFFTKIKDFFVTASQSINFEAIKETIQKVFGNVLGSFNTALNDTVYPLISRATEIMKAIGPKLTPIFEDMGAVVSAVVDIIATKIIPLLAPMGQYILDSINPFVDMIGGLITVIKGIVTGDFTTVMNGFGQMFNAIADQIKNVQTFFKNSWNAFGKAFKTLGDFFNNIPLYIEKYISDIPVLGALAQKAGLVRSAKDIDKELEARLEQARKELAAEGTTTPPTAGQGATPSLSSGMQSPNASRPGAVGTQNLTQEAEKRANASGSASSPATLAEATATVNNSTAALETMQTTLKNLAANSPTQEQSKQLNTLIEQLIEINKQQLEINQDLVKAAKGSYKPI